MTPERIAEIFRLLASLERTNFIVGFDGWVKLVRECLDALEAAQAQLELDQGGKVVIPSPTFAQTDALIAAWNETSEMADERCNETLIRYTIEWARDHAVAAVPEGTVLVDAGELEALRRSHAEWIALSLSMDPINRKANAEGSWQLHRVQHLVEIAKRLGFPHAMLVVGDEANDERMGECGPYALESVSDNYGNNEEFRTWYGILGLGGDDLVGLPVSDDPDAPRCALRASQRSGQSEAGGGAG